VVGQVVAFGILPILTRLVAPDAFATFAVGAAIFGVILAIGSLRYEQAIILPATDEDALTVVALATIVLAGVVATCALVVVFAGAPLARLLNSPGLPSIYGALLVSLTAGGMLQIGQNWALRELRYSRLATARIAQAAGSAGGQLALVVAGQGPIGLTLGDAGGKAMSVAILLSPIRRIDARRPRWADIRRSARLYRRFPLYSSWSALLNMASVAAPTVLLGIIFGPPTAAWYALAQRVGLAPLSLVGTAAAQAFTAEAARTMREGTSIDPILRSATVRLVAFALPCAIGLVAVGLLGFEPLFGAQWSTAGVYLAILAPMIFAQLVASPTGSALDILQRQDLHLARELGRVLFFTAAVGIAVLLGFSDLATVATISLASTAGYVVYIAATFTAVRSQVVGAR
jgi:O-antigen/teichoic acid export membrane protein